MKVALIIGHDEIRPGARASRALPSGRVVPGQTEYAGNFELCQRIASDLDRFGHQAQVYRHTPRDLAGRVVELRPDEPPRNTSYHQTVMPTIQAVNEWGADCVLELHWNAVPERNSEGLTMRDWSTTFAFHWPGSVNGERLGFAVSRAISQVLRTTDRGSVPRRASWAGATFHVLRSTRAPAILVESHNGANPTHHNRFIEAMASGELPEAIAEAIANTVEMNDIAEAIANTMEMNDV